ncbi:MAG TPA: acetate--CoA ligase family protein [Bacteroidales bacterium]|nr:acetate--CoA ligase family protein [Bacteroidales bacterium]
MINNQLIDPKSIVVVGGSNDTTKPGGKILKNIIDGGYKGSLYVTNPKEIEVQGIRSFQNPADLPQVDLAVIAIAARFVPETIELLTSVKNTRAFIVLSAGFSEESDEGARLEKQLVDTVNKVNGALIGPNCVGILTQNHHSIFTYPIPKLDPKGFDFISGSGATACFIMEGGIPKGLTFSNVFSVGNSAQMGVEEILKYLDETYDPESSSSVKLLYLEHISKPELLLKHAQSLIKKGCRIAAIKAGSSEAGSRAASSHTGALASPDTAVDALFRKAGIVRCYSREELISVASVLMHLKLQGKSLAIITHAGGPAVMLTDALTNGGLEVPHIDNPASRELLSKLFPGSSVGNPIDFLATGTADQLGLIIDYVEKKFDEIDGMVVIFGTPGLLPVFPVYDVLHEKMMTCRKPIYPVLPSIVTARNEVEAFIGKGHINFPDEVSLGQALCKVYHTPFPPAEKIELPQVNTAFIRRVIDEATEGYLSPEKVQGLLDAAGIPRVAEAVANTTAEAIRVADKLGYPVVMKVVGPVHKSDIGGVALHINDAKSVEKEFSRMMKLPGATAILIQPMLSGTELFAGAKREGKFGHLVLCGMGGIFIEVFKDIATVLSPVSNSEALTMIRSLRSFPIIKGVRGKEGISEEKFANIVQRLSALVEAAPEISELDLNPLLGKGEKVIAVDARIKIERDF